MTLLAVRAAVQGPVLVAVADVRVTEALVQALQQVQVPVVRQVLVPQQVQAAQQVQVARMLLQPGLST
jgi:hypothetical protein